MAKLEERIAELERRIAALEGRGNGAVTEDQPKYRKVTDRDPRVGDYVKFDEAPCSYLTAGKYYEIVEIDDFGDPQIIDDDGDEFDTYGHEFEVYELVAEGAPKFEVGDYVKVVGGISCHIGKIAKIECIFDGRAKFSEVINDNQHPLGGSPLEYLVKLTAEEVAKAKEEIRWSKIGRKPGEFKKGDIVRVIEYDGSLYNGHEYGLIGEVEYDITIKDPQVDGGVPVVINDISFFNHVELICPVEHRFDREGANV
jgi:hypothetical protein